MTGKHLHIVTHVVPWPADYGGVIDLFYKIKTLHKLGINIHLHCFSKDMQTQPSLQQYCSSIHYYKRKNHIGSFSFSIPYIVNSRASKELVVNLQKNNYPVLLEGIHCCHVLHSGALGNRKVVVRLHNVEHEYYRQLAQHEKNIFKKFYFAHESKLLKKFEQAIASKATFIAVSKADADVYKQSFNANDIHFLPVFSPYTLAVGKEGKGCFCLYHGNLAINENEEAATWLLQNVFNNIETPFVIAGKKPTARLQKLVGKYPNACMVANPTNKEMQDMICKAHVHVLPSLNKTGVKLKLLNALFNGRHCLGNKAAVNGSGVEKYCHIAEDASSFKQKIKELYQQPFTQQEIEQRQGLLQTQFNNEVNANKLMTFLW